ncbi:anti-sigma B factor antagonist/stage II sporulation protein AA (anti-sigma F factor antagonist) [Streptosporangium album]|uniref:Anti-sigma factor antagonist n=1 Tax=Streptosporangium album TaxID=47479 RepID=A0A7W7W8Y5_9ACTN|nr:STAS domain-containing protein [Streptosporangium album]MBB4938458.1 anti-sigma B factor antagonist/stage II sporulation protein AA (anti-sigma F factor antagonist) [Streptosporangium album]
MSTAVHVTAVSDDTLEDVCMLALAGELDYTNAERFQHDLQESIGSEPCDLIIDLSDLTFCDSTGIQVFLAVRKLVHDRGRIIVLARLHPRLERLFHLTGLTSAFSVQSTVDDAVELLRSRQSS